MKNILFIVALLVLASCGGESKAPNNASTVSNVAKPEIKKAESLTTKPTTVASNIDNDAKSNLEVQPKETEKIETTKKEIIAAKETKSNTNEKVTENKIKETSTPKTNVTTKNEIIDSEKTNAEAAKQKALAEQRALEEKKKLEEIRIREQDIAQQKAATETAAKAKLESEKLKAEAAKKTEFSHAAFDALLKKHVSATGKVNYKGLKKDEAKLNAYLSSLEATPIGNDWGRKKKMAYWINAYNAYTLKLIVKNYPISSITKLHGGKPWDVKWIKLNGKTLSLNNIENDILRPQYKDARIHFAVNCAAKSCPPLLNRAWTASNLESNFNKQAKAFINNSKYNSISGNSAKVSKIFEWYGEDFGNLTDYLNKFANSKIESSTTISFMEYDWALNE